MSEKKPLVQMLRECVDYPILSCDLCDELRGSKTCDEIKCTDGLLLLADRIEAELDQAREDGFYDLLQANIGDRGYPALRPGENFGEWLDRCFLRLPLVDGEPLAKGMMFEGLEGPVESFCVYDDGSGEVFSSNDRLLFPEYDEQDRDSTLHLAKPKVLDADGVPVCEEETVYGTGREQHRYTVQVPCDINPELGERFSVRCYDHNDGGIAWVDPSMLTHKEPETMERIREDAAKALLSYWNCCGVCSDCPSKIDGEEPWRRYGLSLCDCDGAQRLDLVARTEKLLGGE